MSVNHHKDRKEAPPSYWADTSLPIALVAKKEKTFLICQTSSIKLTILSDGRWLRLSALDVSIFTLGPGSPAPLSPGAPASPGSPRSPWRWRSHGQKKKTEVWEAGGYICLEKGKCFNFIFNFSADNEGIPQKSQSQQMLNRSFTHLTQCY